MDKVIEELVQIETRAEKYLAEVNEYKRKLSQRIQARIHEIQEEIDKDTKQKIRDMNTTAYDESDAKIRMIIKLSQEQFSELENTYAENSHAWQNQIFNNVLGR